MICSAQRARPRRERDGILVLDAAAPVGAPLPSVLAAGDDGARDRAHAEPRRLGLAARHRARGARALRRHAASARDGRARGAAQRRPTPSRSRSRTARGCPRYAARVVRGVRVGPSPAWLAAALEAAGVRRINNVVDVTNLVLLELGQPLHAFDLARVRGAQHPRARGARGREAAHARRRRTRALERRRSRDRRRRARDRARRRDGRRRDRGDGGHARRPARERALRSAARAPHGAPPRPRQRGELPLRARRRSRRPGAARPTARRGCSPSSPAAGRARRRRAEASRRRARGPIALDPRA